VISVFHFKEVKNLNDLFPTINFVRECVLFSNPLSL